MSNSVLHETHGVTAKTVADIDNGAHERTSGTGLPDYTNLEMNPHL